MAVGAAAGAGAVLLILSAGVGLKPILRPLMPFDDKAAQVEVQVPPAPVSSPPLAIPVTEAAGTSSEEPEPEDRAVAISPEPTRAALDSPATAPRVISSDSGAAPPAGEQPAEPPPIEEPEPVVEQPQSGVDGSGPPPPLELPPLEEEPQATRPAEDGDGEGDEEDDVVELADPPADDSEDDGSPGEKKKPKDKKKGKS